MRDDDFEWDDDKAAANLAKHGVPFDAAREAFDDRYALDDDDDRIDYGEDRYMTLGQVEGRLLAVTWTSRGSRIRIVSARLAEPSERRRYHER